MKSDYRQGVVRIPYWNARLPISLEGIAVGSGLLAAGSLVAFGKTFDINYGVAFLGGISLFLGSGVGAFHAKEADKNALRRTRIIYFLEHFGADRNHLVPMHLEERIIEARSLAQQLNDEYVQPRRVNRQLAKDANEAVTDYIASITGQRVETPSEVQRLGLHLLNPFLTNFAADCFSDGRIRTYGSWGILQPIVLSHEFSHQKGYRGELEAQVLAFLSCRSSEDPAFRQAATYERFSRQAGIINSERSDTVDEIVDMLRPELQDQHRHLRRKRLAERLFGTWMSEDRHKAALEESGQSLDDYSVYFTNFLHTIERCQGHCDRNKALQSRNNS